MLRRMNQRNWQRITQMGYDSAQSGNIGGGRGHGGRHPDILTHAAKTVRSWRVAQLDSEEFAELIDLIYSAATDSTQWAQVTQALGKVFDAPYTLIFGFNPSTAGVLYAASSGLSPDALKQYEQTYSALDIRAPPALRAPAGSILTDETTVERHTYRASPIYNEYLKPLGAERLLTVVPYASRGRHVIISVNRSNRAGEFDSREGQFLRRLTPHFQRALLISEKLGRQSISCHISSEMMTRVHFGVIILGAGGAIAEANEVAQNCLAMRETLMSSSGRLVACNRDANDKLQRAIGEAENITIGREYSAPGLVMVANPGAPTALYLLLAPIPESRLMLESGVPRVIAFVFQGNDRPNIAAADLHRVYGITLGEARVIARLVSGHTIGEISQQLTLAIETVRTHVKRALFKMQCESQGALIRKILLGPIPSMRKQPVAAS